MKKSVINIFNEYSPVSAYWAGFLAADGRVDIDGTIGLELQEQDVKAIQQFKSDIMSEHAVCFREATRAYSIRFVDRDIAESLYFNYSVSVDKTHGLIFPTLPPELYPHYLRGHFDGDGCFTEFFNNRPTASYRVYITSGSYSFLEDMVEFLIQAGVTKGRSICRKSANCWHIQYGVKDAASFLNYIYCDNSIDADHRLDRKYDKYLSIIVNGNRSVREIKV